jgi:hypothetical protein
MKKYIYILLLTGLISSCSKDFLDETTKGLIRPEDYFKTTSDLEKCVNALFSSTNLMYNTTATLSWCCGGDDVTTLPGGNKEGYKQFDVFSVQDNNDRYRDMYTCAYGAIKQANVIIQNIDKFVEPVDNPQLLNDQKNRALGEAHFIRALAYYNLVRMCNEIPLVTDYLSVNYELKKSPAADVYALIVEDLTQAETLLPVKFSAAPNLSSLEQSTLYARSTSGSAKALLASVYLTMAGYPVKDNTKYALAAAKAKEVIDNEAAYGYSLMANYADLWKFVNNKNSETVVGLYYNHVVGDWSDNGTWANGNMCCPLSYKPGDFGGWDDVFAELTFFKEFPEGPRKDATFLTQARKTPTDTLWHWQYWATKHPYYKKFLDIPGWDENNANAYFDWWSSRSVMVIRYAEVLLVYAEAKAMSGGPDALAYTCVNRVKSRAGLPDLTPGLTATAFRDSVIMERKWEFAGNEPCARWMDMVRTETVESATAKRDPKETPLVTKPPTKDNYFAPIPSLDRVLNPNM